MRKALYILGQLSDADIEWMLAFGERRSVPRGEVIVRENKAIEDVFLILDGSFSVTDQRLKSQELARLGSGEIVGEMSFVDSAPPSATVTAVEDGRVLAIPRQRLREKIEEDDSFAARFYRALAIFLADRLRSTVRRLGYGEGIALDEDVIQEDELGFEVLDTVHVAGLRFKIILERLSRG